MATKKVVYFTAGINATAGELADIAKLNAAAEALAVPVTGTYTTTATVSVANGVVTGIVLS